MTLLRNILRLTKLLLLGQTRLLLLLAETRLLRIKMLTRLLLTTSLQRLLLIKLQGAKLLPISLLLIRMMRLCGQTN